MRVSVVIPLWNGVDSIGACLRSLFDQPHPQLEEVICVDNASSDGSDVLVAAEFPQVRLLVQPVNLGFAGGVNVGAAAAHGDLIALLNQDCLVQPGWVDAYTAVFASAPDCGIVGSVIVNADGSINHAGARITRPLAYGEHLLAAPGAGPYVADYVNGAFVCCRRDVWQALGGMDESFYPAYYEESDYCYRLRRRGYEVMVAPAARATHLLTGRSWQQDPIRHAAQQNRSRYRFVIKQFDDDELATFFVAELEACRSERYFHPSIGRALASRDLLRNLDELVAARAHQLQPRNQTHTRRILAVHLAGLYQAALNRSHALTTALPDLSAAIVAWQTDATAVRTEFAAIQRQTTTADARNAAISLLDHLNQALAQQAEQHSLAAKLHYSANAIAHTAALQDQLLAVDSAFGARLDAVETSLNQRVALLDQRLDLTENLLFAVVYRHYVLELLAGYESF